MVSPGVRANRAEKWMRLRRRKKNDGIENVVDVVVGISEMGTANTRVKSLSKPERSIAQDGEIK